MLQKLKYYLICILSMLCLTSCKDVTVQEKPPIQQANNMETETIDEPLEIQETTANFSLQNIPRYSGEPYVEINSNEPDFTYDSSQIESYESYGDLDFLGRCGIAESCIGSDLMPTEDRGTIGQVKPSGWHTVKYDNVEGKYLYNRCHLIGYQLTAENANEKNLITGTRYMNTVGMLSFEDMVADYIHETNNHVMYRVTPVFEGDNLLVSGVQMEAESVEDNGSGISYNVFVYNVQPGITIDYSNGESSKTDDSIGEDDVAVPNTQTGQSTSTITTYMLNKNTHKFHDPDCSSVQDTKPQNREEFVGGREELIQRGYAPCGRCNP